MPRNCPEISESSFKSRIKYSGCYKLGTSNSTLKIALRSSIVLKYNGITRTVSDAYIRSGNLSEACYITRLRRLSSVVIKFDITFILEKLFSIFFYLFLGMIIYPILVMIWMARKLRVRLNQRMKLMIFSPGARIPTIGNRLPTSPH